jgi:hypothetical protein
MNPESAETLALKGLAHVAADADSLARFLDLSGLGPEDLRARAGDPELLAAVMDFLLADDARLMAFCAAEGLTPVKAHAIRRALPGASDPSTSSG